MAVLRGSIAGAEGISTPSQWMTKATRVDMPEVVAV